MKAHFLRLVAIIGFLCILQMSRALPSDQVNLRLPIEEGSSLRVSRASKWLVKHIVRGTLENDSELGPLTLVAWHDPSLAPNDKNALAAYAITDSLWASRSLSLQFPTHSEEIRKSLQRLNCLQNNLHEVLFQPVRTIHHRSDDDDIMHGCLIGTFRSGDKTISVRSFRMRFDANYSIGHPALFAEHAVYQSLFHYWNGNLELAKDHLKSVFASAANPRPAIFWDRERAILVDHVTADEHRRLTAKQATECRQFTFKLALIVYAVRLMKLDVADEAILRQMQRAIWSAQVESGGLSHFIVTNSDGKNIPCPDATAEATAIAILSETIVPVAK
jgi:hypothetical protein